MNAECFPVVVIHMGRRTWAWIRVVGGAAVLGVIVWRLGTGPIVDGIRTISGPAVLAALAITAVTTTASAYRWSVVAGGLGGGVPWPGAIAAYYRSQFLNSALPGGILGDAHRAVRHGKEIGDVRRAARAVVWERFAGQVVQVVLTLGVLAVFASPVQHDLATVTVALAVGATAVAIGVAAAPGRLGRTIRADIRDGLCANRRWIPILLASTVVVVGHTTTFLIAARTAATDASLARLLPLALLVLLAMTVPTNIGGWGPREGVAAWLFGAAGLGAAQGVTAATTYGVLVLIAGLPGAVVLIVERRRRGTVSTPDQTVSGRRPVDAASG